MAKPRLTVDAEALAEALETDSPEIDWVLDLRSGEVLPLIDPEVSGEEADAGLQHSVETEPDRFIFIETIPSHEGFRAMERFTENLASGPARVALESALGREHPFRAFKDTLHSYPDLRTEWFRFKDEWLVECAREWLEENVPNAKLSARPVRPKEA